MNTYAGSNHRRFLGPKEQSGAFTIGMNARGMVILSGTSHPRLAEDVARRVGVPLCNAKVLRDDEGEIQVDIIDSVRGRDVFIIQSEGCISDGGSVNDHIMELMIMCYACKTSCARRIIGVVPYLPYSRQSKMRKRGCIAAKLLAAMLARAGMNHLITLDLFHKEIQGFFDFPIDNLRGSPFLLQYIQEQVQDYRNAIVVARYPGVTRRANSYAERLRLNLAVLHGEPKDMEDGDIDGRNSPPPSFTAVATSDAAESLQVQATAASTPIRSSSGKLQTVIEKQKPPLNLVGDVHGRIALLIDDIIDEVSMTNIVAAAKVVKERGAYKIYVVATHGIFSEEYCEMLEASPIDKVIVTNTVSNEVHEAHCGKIQTIDISLLLSEAVRRIYYGESMSQLFRNIPMED